MTNLDALLGEPIQDEQVRLCTIGKHLVELPEPYRTALEELVNSKTAAINVALKIHAAGLQGNEKSVGRHRAGQCLCPREKK